MQAKTKMTTMRKIIILTGILCCLYATAFADDPEEFEQEIDLEVDIYDPTGNDNNTPRTPILLPYVTYSNNVIHFRTTHSQYLLRIVGDNGVVYETTVYPTDKNVLLPYLPLGEYKLMLLSGNIILYGYFIVE